MTDAWEGSPVGHAALVAAVAAAAPTAVDELLETLYDVEAELRLASERLVAEAQALQAAGKDPDVAFSDGNDPLSCFLSAWVGARLAGPIRCRGCGCTDDRACPGGCFWVAPDLCSACAWREVDAGVRAITALDLARDALRGLPLTQGWQGRPDAIGPALQAVEAALAVAGKR